MASQFVRGFAKKPKKGDRLPTDAPRADLAHTPRTAAALQPARDQLARKFGRAGTLRTPHTGRLARKQGGASRPRRAAVLFRLGGTPRPTRTSHTPPTAYPPRAAAALRAAPPSRFPSASPTGTSPRTAAALKETQPRTKDSWTPETSDRVVHLHVNIIAHCVLPFFISDSKYILNSDNGIVKRPRHTNRLGIKRQCFVSR